ncbi:putative receptor protein kinase zmpk1 [Quercus suber]|uniref:Receptor protein kinase zmpk1 n=1 Tax=Quercus suber TaxID=58331 RepID=A0AAW0JXS3_QUESU
MATSKLPHFCCLLLLLLPFLPTVLTYTEEDCNIRLDSFPLVAGKNSNPITSRLEEFSFGFHPLEGEKENQFLLAVWFCKTKEPTIVWYANGNKPAPENSELRLSSNNEFVLYDHEDNELWKAPTPRNSKSSCVAIRDNGNLVILDEQYNPIWESFNEPKDTNLAWSNIGHGYHTQVSSI